MFCAGDAVMKMRSLGDVLECLFGGEGWWWMTGVVFLLEGMDFWFPLPDLIYLFLHTIDFRWSLTWLCLGFAWGKSEIKKCPSQGGFQIHCPVPLRYAQKAGILLFIVSGLRRPVAGMNSCRYPFLIRFIETFFGSLYEWRDLDLSKKRALFLFHSFTALGDH